MNKEHYFRLLDEMRGPARWHLGMIHTSDGCEHWLPHGRLFHREDVIVPIHHPGPPLDLTITTYTAIVAKDQLADKMVGVAGDSVQIIPCYIADHPGYSLVHPLLLVECVDDELSIQRRMTAADGRPDLVGKYDYIYKLVLHTSMIPEDAHIFRILGWEVALIVSETMKQAMETAGCHGAVFVPVELS